MSESRIKEKKREKKYYSGKQKIDFNTKHNVGSLYIDYKVVADDILSVWRGLTWDDKRHLLAPSQSRATAERTPVNGRT
jgi:hypothetical protein